jgi:hypothetical protein
MSWRPGSSGYAESPKKLTLLERFLATKPAARGEIRDEVVEVVGRAGIFDVSDLIAVMKAGYKTLPSREKNEFMRRVLFELKKSIHP